MGGSFKKEIKQNDKTLTKEAVIEIKEIKVSAVEPRGRRKKANPKKNGKFMYIHVNIVNYSKQKIHQILRNTWMKNIGTNSLE